MHRQPGSPHKPCRVTYDGRHQWFGFRKWLWSKSTVVKCWICGAVKPPDL